MKNIDYISILRSLRRWNVTHDNEYPEMCSCYVEITDHQLELRNGKYLILISICADVSIDIGNHFPSTHTEPSYSEDSEITDVNINMIDILILNKDEEHIKLKSYQRNGIEEVIREKVTNEIQEL